MKRSNESTNVLVKRWRNWKELFVIRVMQWISPYGVQRSKMNFNNSFLVINGDRMLVLKDMQRAHQCKRWFHWMDISISSIRCLLCVVHWKSNLFFQFYQLSSFPWRLSVHHIIIMPMVNDTYVLWKWKWQYVNIKQLIEYH